ncbi:hemerythrin domain-containing protein [Nocardioides currus]|nr:hemerythrin domain-containing protein [Nocardioides currus]
MATMSMNQIIHAAVRRDVARTEQALRSMADGDGPRARQLQTAWRNLVRELTHHHEAEDDIVWPFLLSRGADEALMAAMEDEHVAMKEALTSASRAIDGVVADPSRATAEAAADVIAGARTVIDNHLDHEEREAEPLIAGLEDDPEWKARAKRMRPQAIRDAGSALAWMQDGAGPQELAALRATIPGPVVSIVTKVFGRRYTREIAPTWR